MEVEAPRGYGVSTMVGAVLATVFFAPFALILALVLHGAEADPEKRAFLRTWAWLSGLWLLVPAVLVLLAANGYWL